MAPRRRSVVDVYRYLDYRAFLADYYKAKKPRGFSYRAFSRDAGLSAPNYLKLVIDGQRNLTPAVAARVAAACRLAGEACEYFVQLVAFNQASTTKQKNAAYARLSAFERYRRAQKLELAQAAYHSTWYLPALRELVASPEFREDPAWLAEVLCPQIKPAEVQRALDSLLALGLLVRDDEGRLRQSAPVVSTGPETQGLHIANYHAEMMQRATAAMELVAAPSRDISSLTCCVSPQTLTKLKRRIQDFRREVIELVEGEDDKSQVVQFNLQLFPLTRPLTPPSVGVKKRKEPSDV